MHTFFRALPNLCCIVCAILYVAGRTAVASPADVAGGGGDDGYGFAVISYLPEWRYEGANWDTMFETVTHLVLFSLEVTAAGGITALDRIPRPPLLNSAKRAASASGAKILMCFGGNGRSNGFSSMVRTENSRNAFVTNVLELCEKYGFDGIDLNWEYPGYRFGRGYDESETRKDYANYALLASVLSSALRDRGLVLTMAYYPDGRQEDLIVRHGIHEHMDLMHMMAYDQSGKHATIEFCRSAVDQAVLMFPPDARPKLTMGLPFYARNVRTGGWTTYEDIVQRHHPLNPTVDEVIDTDTGAVHYFNGVGTIAAKTDYALERGIGGVMIWEGGQDCRVEEVSHSDRPGERHVATCPNGKASSLLNAIGERIRASNSKLRETEL